MISRLFIFGKLEPAFLGALVGASGTIFAACIAYVAASKTLEATEATARQNAEHQAKFEQLQKSAQIDRERAELQQVNDMISFYGNILAALDAASGRENLMTLSDADGDGVIVMFGGNLPEPLRARSQEVSNRLWTVKNNATAIRQQLKAGIAIDPADRDRLNKGIADRINDLRRFREEAIRDAATRRERLSRATQ